MTLPLADVEKLVRDHADHLGPQLRNTKYVTPEVSAQQSCHLWTVQSCLSLWTPQGLFDPKIMPQVTTTCLLKEFAGMEAFEETVPLELTDGSFMWLRRFHSPASIPEHLLVFE